MRLCYPQLSTGALAQWPVRRAVATRTIANRMADGASVRLSDADAQEIRWDLEYKGLTDTERDALSSFFRQTEGRLRTFLLLDPCGNLLAWSEDPSQPVWSADSLLQAGIAGAGVTQLTNLAQVPRRFRQTVSAPGRFRYCFSAEARATSDGYIRMALSSTDGEAAPPCFVNSEWRQVMCSAELPGEADAITCAIEVPAGMTVELRRLQLQAQPEPSSYRRTAAQGELYPATRFDSDLLVMRGDGIDNHSTSVRLVSRFRS